MTPQHFVALFSRLFSIWLGLTTFQSLSIASMVNNQSQTQTWVVYIIPAITVIVAVLIWMFPMTLAKKLLPARPDDQEKSIHPLAVAAAGSVIIGAATIISTIPTLSASLGIYFIDFNSGFNGSFFGLQQKIDFFTSLVKLSAGIFLLSKPNFIGSKISKQHK